MWSPKNSIIIGDMKYTVQEFKEKFCKLVGDTSMTTPDAFIIQGLNWAIGGLPMVPKLGKIFSKHRQFTLDANEHYKWVLNGDFRRLIDIPMLNFYTSTGGEPCKLNLCYKEPETFYDHNGLVEIKEAGTPCEYTLEQEDDNVYLVLDRPSIVPIIIDYIAYGFPQPVESMDDIIELSAIAEPLVLSALREVYYYEADDWAFGGAVSDYISNKLVPEAIQALNKSWGSNGPVIVGER